MAKKSIYGRPVGQLLREMLQEWDIKQAATFETSRVISWFADKYPLIKEGSVRAHLTLVTTNDPSRKYHPVRADGTTDLLFKVGKGEYRLYDSKTDAPPLPGSKAALRDSVPEQVFEAEEEEEEEEDSPNQQRATEFLVEKDLQRFLARHLDRVEAGLSLYEEDDGAVTGLEFPAGNGRRIDILAIDRNGNFVVLELKVSRGYDKVVGQLLRYVNWVKKHMAAPAQKVRGMIVCRTMTGDLKLACADMPHIELFEYQLSVTVAKIDAESLTA